MYNFIHVLSREHRLQQLVPRQAKLLLRHHRLLNGVYWGREHHNVLLSSVPVQVHAQ